MAEKAVSKEFEVSWLTQGEELHVEDVDDDALHRSTQQANFEMTSELGEAKISTISNNKKASEVARNPQLSNQMIIACNDL